MTSGLSRNMIRRITQRHFRQGSQCPESKTGLLRVYSMQFCPFAHRTRLVLLAKQIPHEIVNVHLKSKPDWLFKKNPLGLVPILELDGRIVYESTTCNDYLDSVYPTPKLNPSDPFQLANDRMLVEASGKVVRLFYRYIRFPDEAQENRQKILSSFQPLEEALPERGSFFGGDQPMIVDYNIWPWVEKINLFCKGNDEFQKEFGTSLPRLSEWIDRMQDVPAVRDTSIDKMLYHEFFMGLVNGTPEYDLGLSEEEMKSSL